MLAQSFTSDRYFHPRPSAAGNGYDATSSGGSNLAQSNTKLVQRIQGDIDKLAAQNPGKPVPIDLVTTSGSGLDPDITPDAAFYQTPRVAKARGLAEKQVRELIQHAHYRTPVRSAGRAARQCSRLESGLSTSLEIVLMSCSLGTGGIASSPLLFTLQLDRIFDSAHGNQLGLGFDDRITLAPDIYARLTLHHLLQRHPLS